MKIKISTDSTADIPQALAKELDIAVIPLTVSLGDQEWLDGVTITPQEFYAVLNQTTTLPVSSAIPPSRYEPLFESAWKEGYTHLIHTSINSKGSSTYQNAVAAREHFYESHPEAKQALEIHILDSLTYSMGYGMAVIEAAKMARRGESPQAILERIQEWNDHVLPTCVTLDLKCVKKSGRITPAAAFLGDAIGLKPIIQFEGGEAHIISKARGEKRALEELLRLCKEAIKPGSPYALIRGGNEEANETFQAMTLETLGYEPAFTYEVGCIISLNTGPNMVGLIYRT